MLCKFLNLRSIPKKQIVRLYPKKQIVRLYPTARAATINEIVLWLNRMLGARNICNECANVLERHWCRPGWEPVGNSAWTEVQTLLGTWITCREEGVRVVG